MAQIVKLLNSKYVYIPKRPGEPFQTFADISKIKKLGWSAKTDLEKGIELTFKSYIEDFKTKTIRI